MRQIILASASKRRSSILRSCGIRHRVVLSRVKEEKRAKEVPELVVSNARRKALAVAGRRRNDNDIVIGADTAVLYSGKIIGKPRTEKEARRLLGDISGKRLFVYTGLCVIDGSGRRMATGWDRSEVRVADIKEAERERCFKLLRPYDKAGGFSIEGPGSFYFDNIRGSYFNVLGLPARRLKGLFTELGLDILDFVGI